MPSTRAQAQLLCHHPAQPSLKSKPKASILLIWCLASPLPRNAVVMLMHELLADPALLLPPVRWHSVSPTISKTTSKFCYDTPIVKQFNGFSIQRVIKVVKLLTQTSLCDCGFFLVLHDRPIWQG
jgi:hypothetical protein